MKRAPKRFTLTGFFLFFYGCIIGIYGSVGFSSNKILSVFFHRNSALVILVGLIGAILVAGPTEIAAAFKKAFISKMSPDGADMEKSRLALVKAAKIVWLFAFACSAFNFISEYTSAGGSNDALLASILTAAYPFLYAIVVANFLLLSMAVFIHKTVIDSEFETLCAFCGIKFDGEKFVCPKCMEEVRERALRNSKKAKLWIGLLYCFTIVMWIMLYYLWK